MGFRDSLQFYRRTFRRSRHRYGLRPLAAVPAPDPRWLFVVGCPRSGTSFTGESLGKVPGIMDLGEIPILKATVPGAYLAASSGDTAAATNALRKALTRAARVGMGGRARCLEQTPEASYVIPQLAEAFPEATFIHLIRDGRDVAASLIERGWLAGGAPQEVIDADGTVVDDAGKPFGDYPRFWVEPDRHAEFAGADEARRCAWAWRRYETAARVALEQLPADRVIHIRYEQLVQDPGTTARALATKLGAPHRAEEFESAFGAAHPRSVGRYRQKLTPEQIASVEQEAGELLRELGYLG